MVNPFPNVYVVGAARAGTAAMCTFLKQHPEIHFSIIKEPHYFADDLMAQPHTVHNKEDYLSLFSDKPFNAEGSVWYLISENAAQNIKKARPDARIVILLRRPWEQIQSVHGLYLRTNNEDQTDLATAIKLCQARAKGESLPANSYFHPGLQYLNNASYYQQVKRFIDVFGEQVKVIAFDDFIADNSKIMNEVFEFIGASKCDDIEYDKSKSTAKLRGQAIRQLKNLPEHLRGKLHPNQVKVHETKDHSVLTPELKLELMDYFKQDVAATGELIGQNLAGLWYK